LLPLVYGLFFVSGATALIYEVAWARMLTQIFGNTTHAIATVLSAFMGGLALGSYVLGRLADTGRNPFLIYGLLEGGVGIYGLVIPALFALTQQAYSRLYGLAEASFTAFSLALFLLCFAAILVPTALMGATLPILSRFSVTQFASLGRRIGDLYAINTLGAVVGCALSGFFLIPELGLRGSVRLAAALNLSIAALVIVAVIWVRGHGAVPEDAGEAPPESRPTAAASHLDIALLAAFGLSGAAAMVYENAWTRALTLVIGMSTYSFTVMLTTFLVGLGVGSFLYARWWGTRAVGVAGFGLLQLFIALSALATIPLFERLPFLFLRLQKGFGDSFGQFLSIQVALSALVMIVPTLLLGTTFPVVARIYTQSLYRIGTSIGTASFKVAGLTSGRWDRGGPIQPDIGRYPVSVVDRSAIGVGCARQHLRQLWRIERPRRPEPGDLSRCADVKGDEHEVAQMRHRLGFRKPGQVSRAASLPRRAGGDQHLGAAFQRDTRQRVHRLAFGLGPHHHQRYARRRLQVAGVRGQAADVDHQARLAGLDREGHHRDERRTVFAQRAERRHPLRLQQRAQLTGQSGFVRHEGLRSA